MRIGVLELFVAFPVSLKLAAAAIIAMITTAITKILAFIFSRLLNKTGNPKKSYLWSSESLILRSPATSQTVTDMSGFMT